ncbi:MAG: Crp/Fnr family transcriptional regulator [Rhodoferax sp.]|nr:Crp/Fnr family transcriptional regulator [Rhodoferax sp.]
MPAPKKNAISNRLLAALPQKNYQDLQLHLEPVELVFGDILYEAGDQIRHVYFPQDCLVSLLTTVEANRAAEVGLVGSEGMIGVPVALGIDVSPFLAVVQGAGTALRMKTADFRREFKKSAALQGALFGFTHMLMIQVAQTAACNRFHVVTQRLARWLLMTRDRVPADKFVLTQEFLARMLGVRRVGVTEAASALQKLNLIKYSRGNITIIDLPGLEATACGCYEKVNDLYAKVKA